ncbi:SIR2 family protein [Fodinicola feengrottensis]|uniref:SIR2-like domain-containing protein n=1 Tax=Fodinicola feengrottensis TaxID=435914 RepID=A0ABN2GLS1_9ACTN|nr:SIR2 family protein [Fodinicola feengrottensis]
MLLGAGVSIAADVPSAWAVQEDLILKVAQTEGATPTDPFDWYRDRFGKLSTYDDLLDTLTRTPLERQALLRGYFEPTEDEREQGSKLPTAAHAAVARLVTSGLVRVIITINFDRLTEAALREEGIEPTVVTAPADIAGLAPLHTLRCLVVHLHGDYLSPASMLNTAEELSTYPPQLNGLLDRIFDEYGLIISGWSATWDTALREALARCTTRRFGTYWADPFPLGETANDLRLQRSGVYIHADADTFFGKLADTTDALADTERQHPATTAIAVATAKRSLSGARVAVPLHDFIRTEFERVRTLAPLIPERWDAPNVQYEHEHRLAQLETGIEVLLALVATTVYWGNADTDRWWFADIERLARPVSQSGSTSLLHLVRAPATMMLYAAGVAATAAERWPLVVRLLREPTTVDPRTGKLRKVGHILGPQETMSHATASRRLHNSLLPIFTSHLALGTTAYADHWERFEYLRLVSKTDEAVQDNLSIGSDVPHIRSTGRLDEYTPIPSAWLTQELAEQGDKLHLLEAGLFDGHAQRLTAAQTEYDNQYATWAKNAAYSAIPAVSAGMLPSSDHWYPDEYGRWATTQ